MGITLLRNKSAVREYLNHYIYIYIYIYIPLIILQYNYSFRSIIQLGHDIYKWKSGHIIASQALKYGIVFRYSQYDLDISMCIIYVCDLLGVAGDPPPPPPPRILDISMCVIYVCDLLGVAGDQFRYRIHTASSTSLTKNSWLK